MVHFTKIMILRTDNTLKIHRRLAWNNFYLLIISKINQITPRTIPSIKIISFSKIDPKIFHEQIYLNYKEKFEAAIYLNGIIFKC